MATSHETYTHELHSGRNTGENEEKTPEQTMTQFKSQYLQQG